MSEPTSIDALIAYFDSYMDFTEEMPNDISRLISQIHEIDDERRKLIRKLDELSSFMKNSLNEDDIRTTGVLANVDNVLKNFHHKSDEKLALVRKIHELIAAKSDELKVCSLKAQSETLQSRGNASNADQSVGESSGDNNKNSNDDANDDCSTEIVIEQASTSKKPGKRGGRRGQKRAESPPIIYIPGPNEKIYCLCRKISFGDMVGCDNKKCKFEWFHFECVQLTTKPKGKWFCPDCRGKRSNQPKKYGKSK